MNLKRNLRQSAVFHWVRATFGEPSTVASERVLRVLEEAIELAQAEGIPQDRVLASVEYVYRKPVGDPAQEVGGLGVTLLAYCETKGISADEEEAREFDRVVKIDADHFRARHNKKADAGIAVRVKEGQGGS